MLYFTDLDHDLRNELIRVFRGPVVGYIPLQGLLSALISVAFCPPDDFFIGFPQVVMAADVITGCHHMTSQSDGILIFQGADGPLDHPDSFGAPLHPFFQRREVDHHRTGDGIIDALNEVGEVNIDD